MQDFVHQQYHCTTRRSHKKEAVERAEVPNMNCSAPAVELLLIYTTLIYTPICIYIYI